MRNSENYSIER